MTWSSATIIRFGTFILAVAVPLAARAAEPAAADHPQFTAWDKYDVGASATLSTIVEGGPNQKITTVITQKLAKKEADKVTLDVTSTVDLGGGQAVPVPARQQTIQRKGEKTEVKPLGEEKVEAAGETFTCKVYQSKQPSPKGDGDVNAKMWLSEQVPGGIVKMEMTMPSGSITMMLKSYSKK